MSFQKFYINGNDNEFWIERAEEESVFKPFNSTIKFNFSSSSDLTLRSKLDFDLNNKNQSIKSILGEVSFDEVIHHSTSINIFGNEIFNIFPKISFSQAKYTNQYNTASLVVKRQKKEGKIAPPDCCLYIFLDDKIFNKINYTIKNLINYNIELGLDFSNYDGIYLKSANSNSKMIKYYILEKFEDLENYSKYENLRSFFKTNSNCNNKENNIIKLIDLKISYSEKNFKREYLEKLDQLNSNVQQLSNKINSLNQTIIEK